MIFMDRVSVSGYALSLKKLTDRYPPLFLTFLQAFAGMIFFFPALFLPSVELPSQIVPVSFWSVIYLGSVVALGAFGFYNYGVSKIPASQATAFANLIPVFVLIMSAAVLNERFTSMQYMASLLVLGGVVLSQGNKRKNPATSPQPETS